MAHPDRPDAEHETASTTPSRKRSFTVLFMIEMWERFGFYGMAVLLVVFMKDQLGFTDDRANLTWGAFAAMVYAVPTVGGWIGDRVLGARRTTVLGAITLSLGYLLLALPGPTWFWFFSLGLVAAGNGLFKANPNNLVSRLYEGNESELDSAFTLYYMAINIGAFLSQSLSPIVRVHYGWHWAFALSGFGLVFGVAQFFFQRRYVDHVGSEPDFHPMVWKRLWAVLAGTLVVSALIALIIQNLGVARAIVWLSAAGLLGLFLYLISKGQKSERAGLIAMLLLTAQAIIFFICYQQMSTSLTLFAVRNVNLDFYGYQVPPEQFQVLNPFWIAVFSPILAILYTRLGKKGKDPSVGTKFAIGFVLLAAGFFLYGVSGDFATNGHVSAWWMIWGYLFQSIGELLISGLGLSMVSRYVGPSLRGLMMGAWLLATGIAQFLGSMVANLAAIPKEVTDPLKTLPIYTHLFNELGVVAVVAAGIMIAMLPLLNRLDADAKNRT